MFDSLTVLVAFAICLPAAVLASRQSSWLIDYSFFVFVLNRGVRRVVDYHNGYFNQYSLISLTPIIVSGLATLVVLLELNRRKDVFGQATRQVLMLYGLAVAGAFVVGFINVRFGSVYALGDYIAPIGLLGFGALWANDSRVFERWCGSVAIAGVVVAAYGIWQFYTIPPWDAFWLNQNVAQGLLAEGYLGIPEPKQMTLFSTMSERGPAGLFLSGALILLMLRPGTLGVLRWPAVLVVAAAMLLTYTRTSVIQVGLACIVLPLFNRGAGAATVALVAVAAFVVGPGLLNRLPGSETASARVSTIGSIQEDHSFQARVKILGHALADAASEPLGLGIGSHGLAKRVSTAKEQGAIDSTGYVESLRTFGWIGFVLVSLVLASIWFASRDLLWMGLGCKNVYLFRAWYIAGMAVMFSANWLFSISFFWVLAGYCLGKRDHLAWLENRLDAADEAYEPALGRYSNEVAAYSPNVPPRTAQLTPH